MYTIAEVAVQTTSVNGVTFAAYGNGGANLALVVAV